MFDSCLLAIIFISNLTNVVFFAYNNKILRFYSILELVFHGIVKRYEHLMVLLFYGNRWPDQYENIIDHTGPIYIYIYIYNPKL